MRKLIPLLVLAFLFTIAPAAMANHCERCGAVSQVCVVWPNRGFEICDDSGEFCVVQFACGDHSAAPVEPLATEFTVASVERLDEPQTAASETAIASLETPKPATR